MKRKISVLTAMLMLFGLTGCDNIAAKDNMPEPLSFSESYEIFFDSFLLMFLNMNEQITKSELDKFEKVFDEIILKVVSSNAEIIALENPTTKFCEKLRSLLDSGRYYVETRGAESSPRQKNCLGLQDDDYYYLFADAAHSEVRKLCAEQGEHFTISKNELLRQLRKDGFLISQTSRNTISIRDNSNTVINVIMLDKKKFYSER